MAQWILKIGGVPCGIYLGPDGTRGPTETCTAQGRTATVTFQCRWNDRQPLIAGLVGVVGYNRGNILRTPPFEYPFGQDDYASVGGDITASILEKRLLCTAISRVQGTKWATDVEGGEFSTKIGWGGYTYALVTAEFSTPNYQILTSNPGTTGFQDPSNNAYTTTRVRASGEILAPPDGALVFAEGPLKGEPLRDVGSAQPRVRLEVNVTRIRMPIIPLQLVEPLIGGVNNEAITFGTYEFKSGSVLFNGVNPEPRTDPYSGGVVWDIEYQFLVNGPVLHFGDTDPQEADWNWFIDPDGDWVLVSFAGTDRVPFPYVDFKKLFENTDQA
jgi:hypothetical protein